MAIAEMGLKNMAKNGARLTIYLTVPLTILECILRDQATLSQIIGHVASDLIKVGISSILSAIVGLAVGSVTTVAFFPIAVTILCGVFMGMGLEIIDKQYGLTDKLVMVLEKFSDEMEQTAGGILHDAERELMWRGYGFDIDDPYMNIFGPRWLKEEKDFSHDIWSPDQNSRTCRRCRDRYRAPAEQKKRRFRWTGANAHLRLARLG